MQSLRAIIEAFRREVTAALDGPETTEQGTDWKAERVTLSLEVILDEEGKVLARPASSSGTESLGGHRLTIEFRLGSSASGAGAANVTGAGSARRVSSQAAPGTAPESNMDQAYEDLTDLLGAPGFDSSARAAVLCEALQTLTLPQAFALCGALTSPASEVDDETLRRARHQILGIVRSGNVKSPERAAEILTRVFEQWPLPSLVRVVSDRWKTTDHWAK
jgi:hypothetical protein